MKRFPLHFSDVAILAGVAGLVVLVLSRWEPIPRRVGPLRLFEDSAILWPRDDEASLGRLSETMQPWEWARQATQLAEVYGILGRHEEEMDLLQRSVQAWGRVRAGRASARFGVFPAGREALNEDEKKTMVALAEVYARMGRAAEALPLLEELVADLEARRQPVSGKLWMEVGACQRAMKKHEDAARSMHRALKTKIPRPNPPVKPDTEMKLWLEEYRELLAQMGKPADEIEKTLKDEFGQ